MVFLGVGGIVGAGKVVPALILCLADHPLSLSVVGQRARGAAGLWARLGLEFRL